MSLYRKKPVVIEARQFTLELTGRALDDLCEWSGADLRAPVVSGRPYLLITTLEGVMRADLDDWIIKGVQGEFYPCKRGIFEATYEPA